MSDLAKAVSLSGRALSALARVLLVDAEGVRAGLERVRAAAVIDDVPNEWQIALGVARMWHRMLFRFDTVGAGGGASARRTWRASMLHWRPLRFPFLVAEQAIAPLDFSGLLSSRERVIRHLLGAHHGGNEFVYDFELLMVHEGALEELLPRARAVAFSNTERSRWLKDLCVFEGYHELLVDTLERALADGRLPANEPRSPDTSFFAYLAWCAQQPKTPEATLREALAGRYTIPEGAKSTAFQKLTESLS